MKKIRENERKSTKSKKLLKKVRLFEEFSIDLSHEASKSFAERQLLKKVRIFGEFSIRLSDGASKNFEERQFEDLW